MEIYIYISKERIHARVKDSHSRVRVIRVLAASHKQKGVTMSNPGLTLGSRKSVR